jgi:hypothetical protein
MRRNFKSTAHSNRMTDAQVFQARVVVGGELAPADPRVSQARVFAAASFPAEFVRASEARIVSGADMTVTAHAAQARVLAAGRGRIDNRRLRVWWFPLDAHDILVMRLGEDATIIYDLTTEQWADWSGHDLPYWRAHLGQAWTSIGAELLAQGHTTNVVAGDDTWGLLWTLAPELGADESPREDRVPVPFPRVVTGGVPMQMRQTAPCNGVYLTLSLGNPGYSGTSVTLRTSDDLGKSWFDCGTITVEPGNYDQEFAWRSLGLVRHPGRIFSFEDDGVARIGGADMR